MKINYKKNYYTAKEAMERLGINKNRFNYLVRTGRIRKFIPPGGEQGYYLKTEIDRLARELLAFMTYDEDTGIQVRHARTEEDLLQEHELATLLFGSAVHSLETRRAWLARNPDLDLIVLDHGRVVGFLNLLPCQETAIKDFLQGRIRGWDIKPEDVLPFKPGEELSCIIMGMGTTPDVPPSRRAMYGARLISGLMNFLEDLAKQSVVIRKFYATSATPTGIAILRHAGFREINRIGNRIAFELDITTAESPLATEYRHILSTAVPHDSP
uniref:Helix-turn-helix domain-containing protein n=1 Tax=Thermogemmatispora argillosa TaxID=2045280 RepID=A0A455T3V8_9CHLR|nr:hypothetical protein KTA_02630 [Thermogemmatispora argillosa]